MPDPNPDADPEIADASLLFGEAPASSPGEPPPSTAPAEEGGYDVEAFDPVRTLPASAIPPLPTPPPIASRPKAAPARTSKPPKRPASSGVDQVWSRGAEWGESLALFGSGLILVGFMLYTTFNVNRLPLWAMFFLAGLVTLGILAYPLFITLERPVRVTPEQAIKDYFGALSHRVPHYRRMWLLLATDGRTSPAYRSFPEFKAYWKGRLARWKAEKGGGWLNPIEVEVVDFKSGVSAGQTEVEASYTAKVVGGDAPGRPTIAVYPVSLRLVRGPDKMWYLDDGALPP